MNRWIALSCLIVVWMNMGWTAIPDAPYEQEIVTRYSLQAMGISRIQDLAVDSQGQLWVLAQNALLTRKGDTWQPMQETLGLSVEEGMKMQALPDGTLLFAGPKGVWRTTPEGQCDFYSFDLRKVHGLVSGTDPSVWIASEWGLTQWNSADHSFQRVETINQGGTALAWNSRQGLALGTAPALYRKTGDEWKHTVIHGLIDAPITALAYGPQRILWIGNAACINRQHPDGTFDRIAGLQGLPYNQITCMQAGWHGAMWIGTEKGVIRYFPNIDVQETNQPLWISMENDSIYSRGGQWNYYCGPRWMVGDRVVDIAVDKANQTVWLATDQGLSRLSFELWTLAKKARYYEELAYPRHDRYGLVADCGLREFGDLDSYVQKDSDNDGLWTGIYLAALCFEYAVTHDPAVKERAWHHYKAMEKLETITGVPGFFARSYVAKGESHDRGEWHDTPDGEWTWKADTSSDEMVGHMFVYPLVYDLLAESDAEKEEVRGLVSRIMNYVVDNGYYLNDLDGKHTLWGVWAPADLNDNPEWTAERGLNSLQMLSFLIGAYHVTGEQKFMDRFFDLVNHHGYAENALNQKIEFPAEDNHSDDELAFLPYSILFRYLDSCVPDEALKTFLHRGMARSWEIEEPEKSSLWNIIYGTSGAKEFGLQEALWTLREWPMELIDWPSPNSHRLDIQLRPEETRQGRAQIVKVLPPDERRLMRWNGNPFELNGGSGHGEDDPGAWLLPYWMARYYRFIQ